MSKIPVRKCKACGLFSDFTVSVCQCGQSLAALPLQILREEDIPLPEVGQITEGLSVFVQKCSACGTLNFTPDKTKRVRVCSGCTRNRVAFVDPIPFETPEDEEEPKETPAQSSPQIRLPDPDGEAAASPWKIQQQNIQNTVSDRFDEEDDEDDEDEEGVATWGSVLGLQTSGKGSTTVPKASPITFTAIRYGRLSFTLEPDSPEYMLGRSANQRTFLEQDLRVGNNHCAIFRRDGRWFVRDNHSSNGTFVNDRDIGYNGESELRDGDELILGHESDSMAFRVTLR